MIKYLYILIVFTLLNICITKVFAATIKNNDSKIQSLVIAEGSTLSNISLNANQTITVCIKGCFITFPNKDRFVIKSEDTIEINEGRAFFK
ncbi:hypothetical protein [Bartonella sp. F02]|uniref:hypothetical protein n=1 Tax=Bartonella sp. F02 TaxID=2967262 RepID=UPI0022A94C6B|nr:hypothetical protein [Bartonella sp. F02]MCZ2328628.1 hypothetical protein [Bartonella sp. F02]